VDVAAQQSRDLFFKDTDMNYEDMKSCYLSISPLR
jgi:hypothetical protein